MKLMSRRRFIVGMIVLLSISEINGGNVRRRKRESGKNDLNWQMILDSVHKLPLIGNGAYNGLRDLGDTVSKLDELTNGALSRIAGGYPPCTIDLDGIRCNGKAKDGGIVGITTDLINSSSLPRLVKTMILDYLDAFVFPSFDMIFGIRVDPSKKV